MNKLTYKNHKWELTVDGKEVPNTKVVYDSLKMRNDEYPSVEIMLDEIDIEGIEVEEADDMDSGPWGDGVNGMR